MPSGNVVCWDCYHITNRLQPNTYHLDPDAVEVIPEWQPHAGERAIYLPESVVDDWSRARDVRVEINAAGGNDGDN